MDDADYIQSWRVQFDTPDLGSASMRGRGRVKISPAALALGFVGGLRPGYAPKRIKITIFTDNIPARPESNVRWDDHTIVEVYHFKVTEWLVKTFFGPQSYRHRVAIEVALIEGPP